MIVFLPRIQAFFGKEDLKNYNKGSATDYTDLDGLICANPV